MKCVLFHEFGPSSTEWQMPSLQEALREVMPDAEFVYRHGFIREYRGGQGGGLTLGRLLNYLAVYLCLPWWLYRERPDWVVVRTSPPCVQLWVVFLGWLLGFRTVCWMMDWHPEMEARILERHRALRPISRLLRILDGWSLEHFEAVIAIDSAMAEALRGRVSCIIEHPTWEPHREVVEQLKLPPVGMSAEASLVILHVGNMGQAHDLCLLRRWLGKVARPVHIHLINAAASAAVLRPLEEEGLLEIHAYGRLEEEAIRELVVREGCRYGLVLLDDRFRALVSPSKFRFYLGCGLPLLYLGPEGSNASFCCERFGAGIALSAGMADAQLEASLVRALDAESCMQMEAGVREAFMHFQGKGAPTLARELAALFSE